MRRRKHSRVERAALQAALEFAQEHGYDSLNNTLPKGRRNSSTNCPVGRAIEGDIQVTSTCLFPGPLGSHEWEPLPDLVQRFIELFDMGRFPELIDHSPEGRYHSKNGIEWKPQKLNAALSMNPVDRS